ncbi:hemagglutinin repeat-containing protein [Tatumella morbirosei]|uniref:two-partner secretion domain-containing protein n=1 Tax=Tatumella morbirosei TaxID=642227 RepID=UPI00069A3147|nr:hemagglutinin repeat-containing protein [Tatumella morbirosei]
MNNNLYRIVFNRARGLMMVVADIAGAGRTAASTPHCGVVQTCSQLTGKVHALCFAILLASGAVQPVQAGIVADGRAPGAQQPTIIHSANGTPQVNIQSPSAAGVSRNKYNQFDVDSKGVILNNSHNNVQTQLGGMVAGNPNLARGEARVILNEVNSRDPSQLNGFVEIAGSKAQVVIANPSGITCNGCGFINANRATLTTGQVQINNGQITGYDVSQGDIVVNGAGMDSRQQDSTDLIARAVKLNAGVWARELKVTAGHNVVDAAHNVVTAKAAGESALSGIAIDVAALGGMYANKIRLVGTESGVGVHNAGNIGASAGDVVVNADGSISNSGYITATKNLQLTTQGNLDNQGHLYASTDTTVSSRGTLTNSGVIAAQNNTVVSAAGINSSKTSVLAAGMGSDGSQVATGDLSLTSQGRLTAKGQNSAAGRLTAQGTQLDISGSQTYGDNVSLLATTGDISTSGATLSARAQFTARTSGTLNNNGGKLSAGQLTLSADKLSNRNGLIQQLSSHDLIFSFADSIDNTNGTLASNSNNFRLSTAVFNNQQGQVAHYATGSLDVMTGQLVGAEGSLFSKGGLRLNTSQLLLDNATTQADQIMLTADTFSHRGGTLLQTGSTNMSVAVTGTLDNQAGSLAANGDIHLQAARLNNQNGKLTAAQRGSLRIITLSSLNNESGSLAAGGNLSLQSTGLNNDNGLLQSGSDMQLDMQDGHLSNRFGTHKDGILSQGTLTLNSGSLDNSRGYIGASGVRLATGKLNNLNGSLVSNKDLAVTTQGVFNNRNGLLQAGTSMVVNTSGAELNNTQGLMGAGQSLNLLSGALINQSGQIRSSGAAQINTQGQSLDNTRGIISVAADAQLNAASINNTAGQIQVAGSAMINAIKGLVVNIQGLIRSGIHLSITTGQLINRDTQADNSGIEGSSVTLNSGIFDNAGGILRATDLLEITGIQSLDNSNGLMSSVSVLNIDGADTLSFINTSGTLIAGKKLNLTTGSLTGDGSVLSQGTLSLVLQQAYLNQGRVIANGDLNLNLGNRNLTNQGIIKAGGVLTLNAGSLDNQQPAEISGGENHLLLTNDLTNRGLLDGGLTHIVALNLTNSGTGRLYGDHVALQTATLNNLAENGIAATIAARGQLDIGAAEINNLEHGLIYSAGRARVGGTLDNDWRATGQASVFNNRSSTLESAGDMTLNIDRINNINDHLVTQVVVVEKSDHHEAVLKGAVNRFDWADIDHSYKNKYKVQDAIMPDGTRNNDFYEYIYTRTVTETQVVASDPSQLIAGGNLTIKSDQVNNHDSRIVAGGLLGGIINQLNNIATVGQRVITDIGTQVHWYAKKSGGKWGGTETSQGKDRSNYQPAATSQTIDLQTMAWQGNSQASGSGFTVAGRNTAGDNTAIIDAGNITADSGLMPVTPPSGQIVDVIPPGDDNTVIRLISPDITLPDNSLFHLQPAVDASYLIETDPRFTQQKKWLSSDYMQNALANDPNALMKRLGDGYYEQQLIKQQILNLTGNRYLTGYSNDEEQYQALMNAGVAFSQQYSLSLGVALTPQQMALLTSDMVWLVKKEVTLADGTVQSVLVPQVYARVQRGDLDGSGALLSGNNIALNVSQDLTNSGHISGRKVTQLTADNLNNSGFMAGNQLILRAATDINNTGGTLQAADRLTAIAGRDINSSSTLSGSVGNITFDRPAGIYVQNDSGQLSLQAGHDINLTASQISNVGAGSQTQLVAGNDLNLATLTTTHSEKGDWGGGNNRTLTQSLDNGTMINGSGDVSLSAGHDLNARAATVTAQDDLNVMAGNSLTLTYGNDSYHLTENSHQSSSGFLSKKSVTTHDEIRSQGAVGSAFSGNTVAIQAGHDLTVTGSSVTGTQDVGLTAGNNLTINTADETRKEVHQYKEKKSGFSATGGVGFSVGSSSLKITDDGQSLTSLGSTIGSTQGNVNLTAGNVLSTQGSEVLAAKDLNLTGQQVNILSAANQNSQTHTVEQKQSGLTLALSGTAGSAINTAVMGAREVGKQSNDRLAVLQGMKSVLSGVQAVQSVSLAEAGGSDGNLVGINLSYGSQSSKSTQTSTQNQSQGSTLTAGNNLTINATGTDINVQGSQLQAGRDVSINAARDVNLFSALNSQTLEGKNESHGASVGAGFNFGQGSSGVTVNASVNKGRGSETGNGSSNVETIVNAGNQLTIGSGRDTTLTGAQVSGEKVILDVGRHLTLTSEQDTDNYDSTQKNISAGASAGAGGGSGSVNLSRDKMHSSYQSVQEQTGIFAGSGGFDVTVGEHTQLNGAVIGSTAMADRNKLDTGTLGFGDIRNSAEYEVEHQSVGASKGGGVGGQFVGNMANSLLVGFNGSDSDSSVIYAAVSEGTINIRNKDDQQQDVNGLSRDVEHANQTLSPIFDKEKEQNRLKEAQLIGEIGSQVGDIARTQGEIAGLKAKKDPAALEAAKETLAGKGNLNPTAEQIAEQAYNTAMAPYGTGSTLQQGIQAATAAVQGLAGGDIAKAIAGGSAPYIANIIGSSGLDDAGKVLAHAAVNAALAAAQGNNALVGAAGAATAEMTGMIAINAYGKPVSELSETEKQTVSALATLAACLAGGLTGDSTVDTVAAAQAGKTTVENNTLSLPSGMMNYGQAVVSWSQYAVDHNLTQEQTQEGLNRIATGEGPSWGTEYKVKPYVKGEVAGGAGAGYYFDTSIDPYQISANRGETLAVGGRISGQMGIQFGPYFPGTIDSKRNNSVGLGLGIISSEVSYGKDGVGFSFGVGPAWGWSGISTNISGEKVDVNGSSGTEFYHYDFNQEKAK